MSVLDLPIEEPGHYGEKPSVGDMTRWNKETKTIEVELDVGGEKKKVRVPYSLALAHSLGYVKFGWTIEDYIANAWNPMPDKEGLRKKSFNNIAVWGDMGEGKTLHSKSMVSTPSGEIELHKLKVGDTILGVFRNRLCLNTVTHLYTCREAVLEVKTSSHVIYCGPEHPFLTQRGWVKAKDFKWGDTLAIGDAYAPLDRTRERGSLEDSLLEPPYFQEGETVLKVSRASKEEKLYDIATSLGNYIANGLVVHNSNLCMQFLHDVYQDDDWYESERHMVLNAAEIVGIYEEVKHSTKRIPMLVPDDVNSIFSKELWYEDKELFIKAKKAFNLIRPKVANFACTIPTLDDLVSIFSAKLNFEVIIYPNRTFMVERYARMVDLSSATSSYFRKLLIQYTGFKLLQVPTDAYKKYEERRLKGVDSVFSDLTDYMKNKGLLKDVKTNLEGVKGMLGHCEACGNEWLLNPNIKQPRCTKCHSRQIKENPLIVDPRAAAMASSPPPDTSTSNP